MATVVLDIAMDALRFLDVRIWPTFVWSLHKFLRLFWTEIKLCASRMSSCSRVRLRTTTTPKYSFESNAQCMRSYLSPALQASVICYTLTLAARRSPPKLKSKSVLRSGRMGSVVSLRKPDFITSKSQLPVILAEGKVGCAAVRRRLP